MLQSIFISAPRHELPDPARTCSRKRQGLKRALRLRQVNQVLRHALFSQYPLNHSAVTPRASQTGFHNGPPARGLEKIQKRKYFIVHRQRQVV
jgi:hypothetical protein